VPWVFGGQFVGVVGEQFGLSATGCTAVKQPICFADKNVGAFLPYVAG
jgi:hypothetical protein